MVLLISITNIIGNDNTIDRVIINDSVSEFLLRLICITNTSTSLAVQISPSRPAAAPLTPPPELLSAAGVSRESGQASEWTVPYQN